MVEENKFLFQRPALLRCFFLFRNDSLSLFKKKIRYVCVIEDIYPQRRGSTCG